MWISDEQTPFVEKPKSTNELVFDEVYEGFKRSIFQAFWEADSGTIFLFIDLETILAKHLLIF